MPSASSRPGGGEGLSLFPRGSDDGSQASTVRKSGSVPEFAKTTGKGGRMSTPDLAHMAVARGGGGAANGSGGGDGRISLEVDDDGEGMPLTSGGVKRGGDADLVIRSKSNTFWKYVMYLLVVGPWKVAKGIAWVMNRQQSCFRPVSGGLFHLADFMDKHMPTVAMVLVWFWNAISLLLHFLSVTTTWGTIKILWRNDHHNYAVALVALYGLSHYFMAVIMYMEMDKIATGTRRYLASDLGIFLQRLVAVLFWDVQLFASLIHSNIMIEGLTQMMLKGYEEARVAVHLVFNTVPACVVLGLLYDVTKIKWKDLDDIDVKSFPDQVYTALAVSVLNAVEKWLRLSVADPWMHPSNNDFYPIAYMRSNAARVPQALILDWLFRCNVCLAEHDDTLVLSGIYSKYTFNCKGEVRELCDGHKALLLRKALRVFNGTVKYNKAETLARRLYRSKFKHTRSIRALDAADIKPGPRMFEMLGEVLGDATGFDRLLLGNDGLEDKAASSLFEHLRQNTLLELHTLDLQGNLLSRGGCEALASYIASSKALYTLNLSGNPIGDAGAKILAEVLSRNVYLYRLDLSNTDIGAEGGIALAAMLKTNATLRELNLCNSKIGGQGIDHIGKALRSNSGLKELDLSRLALDDRGAVSLAQGLAVNRTLVRLNLAYTRIGDTGAKALCDALQQNTSMQVLDLANTQVDKSWVKLLNNIVQGRGKVSV